MTPTPCISLLPRTACIAACCASITKPASRYRMTIVLWRRSRASLRSSGRHQKTPSVHSSNRVVGSFITNVATRNSTERILSLDNAQKRRKTLPRKGTGKQEHPCHEQTPSMCRARPLSCSAMLPDQTRPEKTRQRKKNPLKPPASGWRVWIPINRKSLKSGTRPIRSAKPACRQRKLFSPHSQEPAQPN